MSHFLQVSSTEITISSAPFCHRKALAAGWLAGTARGLSLQRSEDNINTPVTGWCLCKEPHPLTTEIFARTYVCTSDEISTYTMPTPTYVHKRLAEDVGGCG